MRRSPLSIFLTLLLYGVATLATLAAVAFMTWSAYLAFDRVLLPWSAALATAGALLGFALLLVLLRKACQAFLRGYREAQREKKPPRARSDFESLVDPRLVELIRSKPRSAVLVAMAAGTALGANPDLRRRVGVLLKEFSRDPRDDGRDC